MIISMTGYGKGACRIDEYEASVEVRSLNHRFLDVSVKLPRQLDSKEGGVRELVKKYLERGRITVNISLRQDAGNPAGLTLNEQAVEDYIALLEKLRRQGKIEAPLSLESLLSFPDIFIQENNNEVPEKAWNAVERGLNAALTELNNMRRREGREIEKDLLERVGLVAELVQKIEKLCEKRSGVEFKKLYDRLQSMLDGGELDESRLEMEVALLADRVDITEECIRLKSHTTVFLESVEQPEPVGRKLNFLLQEMNREGNTIGAKAFDAQIAHIVVKIKEEIEKLREQVQNIE